MIEFEWCSTCTVGNDTTGAVQNAIVACKSGCGKKLVQGTIPIMAEYGKKETEILKLSGQLEKLTKRSDQYLELKKA